MNKICVALSCLLASVCFFSFHIETVSAQQFSQFTQPKQPTQPTQPTQQLPRAKDPGLRGGPAGAGGPLPGLTDMEAGYFTAALDSFTEVEGVEEGVGPRMNLDSCGGCHAQPAVGGTSPSVNPQAAMVDGSADTLPSFITAKGPIREARFVRNPDGTPDGGVHDLFTITGREGADGCVLAQPDFATQVANNNVIFRIPTPIFGAGLMEYIPDSAIAANRTSNASLKSSLGIKGRANFAFPGARSPE